MTLSAEELRIMTLSAEELRTGPGGGADCWVGAYSESFV